MQDQSTPTPAQKQYFAQTLYPAIQAIARKCCRRLDGDRDEWIANVVANGWKGYLACLRNGNTSYTAGSLANYAMKRVRVGRTVGNRPGSSVEGYHAKRHGVKQVSCVSAESDTPVRRTGWMEDELEIGEIFSDTIALAQWEGPSARPVDIVAFRMDVPAWLKSLSVPLRRTAKAIVKRGPFARLQDVARSLGITSSGLSRRRTALLADWVNFTR